MEYEQRKKNYKEFFSNVDGDAICYNINGSDSLCRGDRF